MTLHRAYTFADGWSDLETLLRWIEQLYGEALAPGALLARRMAFDAARWLRAAEALARCLVLALAAAVTLTPRAARAKRPARKGFRGVRARGLFCARSAARRRGVRPAHAPMHWAAEEAWTYFGGRERAAEAREAARARGCGGDPR
ncbi:MAG: hypothetical protein NW200_06395, partial [Hyphomonadaceae bacterium]|nr:hypothetical protein [Hyphomonadaceae bacterium]